MKTTNNLNQLKYTVQKLATIESLRASGREVDNLKRVLVNGIEYAAVEASQDLTADTLQLQPERSKSVHYALQEGGVFTLGKESESPNYTHEFKSSAGEISHCKVTLGHNQFGAFWQIEILTQDGANLVVDKLDIPAQTKDS